MPRYLYHSYLVRIWGELSQGHVVWRAAVEQVQSGEQRSFVNVEQLFAWITTDLQLTQSTVVVIRTTVDTHQTTEVHLP